MRFRVEANDLGPISGGVVDVAPLTIFTGRNNTGKTMMARAAQAAFQFLAPIPSRITARLDKDERIALEHELPARGGEFRLSGWVVDRLAESTAADCNQVGFASSLSRKLGIDNLDVARRHGSDSEPEVKVAAALPVAGMTELLSTGTLTSLPAALATEVRASFDEPLHLPADPSLSDAAEAVRDRLAGILPVSLNRSVFHVTAPALDTFSFSEVSSGFREFARWATDIDGKPASHESVSPAALEELLSAMGCRPTFDAWAKDILIEFENDGSPIRLQRASAMVQRLALIALLTQYRLSEGDLLIIESPEAHLHPETVRPVARALVWLAAAGVTVLCVTHSSTLLHEISNCMLRHQAGTAGEPAIAPDDIAAYRFRHSAADSGTVVDRLDIDPEWGLPEDEHVAVADSLNEETARLVREIGTGRG